jgi:hypothetical protein
MEPKAKVLYERYVAALGGVGPLAEQMPRFEDLNDRTRAAWVAVADPDAPRQPCHGSLLPPVTGTLVMAGSGDELKT